MALSSRAGRRLLLGAVAAVAAYYALWGGEYSAFHLRRLDEVREAKAAELAETRAAVDSLRTYAALLEKDDATLERVARERFGMIRDGETLYRFFEAEPEPAAARRVAKAP
ncbi:MAG TPA: septum formation initiator family protein [Longimicrobiaceae bacterium]|nr:septum formation initiator family protein [Longimicrobiaceae bacterium]